MENIGNKDEILKSKTNKTRKCAGSQEYQLLHCLNKTKTTGKKYATEITEFVAVIQIYNRWGFGT